MGQAGTGKDGKFLSPHQGIETVDGGNARLDELPGVGAGDGVDGLAVHVTAQPGNDGWTVVAGLADTVEYPAEYVRGEGHFKRRLQETDPGIIQAQVVRAFEDLHHYQFIGAENDLAVAFLTPLVADAHAVAEGHAGHTPEKEQAIVCRGSVAVFLLPHEFYSSYSWRSFSSWERNSSPSAWSSSS